MFDFRSLEGVCPICKGVGTVVPTEWITWQEKRKALMKKYETKGVKIGELFQKATKELSAEKPIVPEEVVCSRCNGKQKVLTEKGKMLIGFLKKHLDL